MPKPDPKKKSDPVALAKRAANTDRKREARARLNDPNGTGKNETPNTDFRRRRVLPKYRPKVGASRGSGADLLLPVLWMTEKNEHARRNAFERLRKHPTKALFEREGLAVPGPIHAAIDDAMGRVAVKIAYLYVGHGDEPLFRVAIHRGDDGLWRVKNARPTGVTEKPKDGVLFHVSHVERAVEALGERLPKITRVWGGGEIALTNLAAIAESYERRRQISHAYVLSRLVGGCYRRQALPIYLRAGGRVDFEIDETRGDGWIDPFGVLAVKSRAYVQPPDNAPLWIVGDDPGKYDMTTRHDRHVVPRFRPHALLRPDPAPRNFLTIGVGDLFRSSVLPYVVVVRRYLTDWYVADPNDPDLAGLSQSSLKSRYEADLPGVGLRRRGDRFQEWLVPNRYGDGPEDILQPYVLKTGRYIEKDGEPKIHVTYADLETDDPEEPLEPIGVDPSPILLDLLIETAMAESPDAQALRDRRRTVHSEIMFRFKCETAEDAEALFRRKRCRLNEARSTTLRELYASYA